MSKKTLLEEGTVRQFMKLANLRPLAGDFINEKYYDDINEQPEGEEELPPEAGLDPMADEEDPMDMEMAPEEEGAEGALAEVSEEAVEELINVVADALEAATGVEIEVTGGEEGLEGEEELAMGPEDEEGMDDFAPAEEVPVGDEDEELAEINMIDEDAVMKETYRRVTKRLSGMNKQHKLVESVTNRIMSRLSKSK